MWSELPFFRDLHSKVDLFRTPDSHFKLWRPAIFEPFDLGYSIIRLLKALSPFYWNLKWKWEYLGSEKPQTKFSEGGAFLVNWAWPTPGWCHIQFLYKFWKLCVRAFKWYIICGTFSTGRFFKWARQKTVNLGVRYWFSETVHIVGPPPLCLKFIPLIGLLELGWEIETWLCC